MRWLAGEERSNSYLLRLHLDETQVDEHGQPMLGSVLELEWSKAQSLEISKVEHWRLGEALTSGEQATPLPIE